MLIFVSLFVTFPCEIDYCEYYPWNIHKFCDNRIYPKPERERNNSHEDTVFLMPTNFCFDSFVISHEKFITVNVILEILINYETTEYPQNEREIKTTHMRIWFSLSMLIFVLFYFHVKFITVNVILKIFINSGTTEYPQNHRERERKTTHVRIRFSRVQVSMVGWWMRAVMHVVHVWQRVGINVQPGLAMWWTMTVGQCQATHATEGVESAVGMLFAQAVGVDPVGLVFELGTALRALIWREVRHSHARFV